MSEDGAAELRCMTYRVSGRVQGVFFRDSTRELANRLGLTGHARNLADGTVAILACGAPPALEALEQWLESGPPLARVDRIEAEEVKVEPPPRFTCG